MKKISLSLVIIVVSSVVYADVLLKTGEAVLTKVPIVSSSSLTREIMAGMGNSVLDNLGQQNVMSFPSDLVVPGDDLSDNIARLIAFQQGISTVDGYISSFPQLVGWNGEMPTSDALGDIWLLLHQTLEQTEEPLFSGAFLPNIDTLEYASQFSTTMGPLRDAFQQAYKDGLSASSGFFVIAEHPTSALGNPDKVHRLKDLYIVDLKNNNLISYNKSKADAWKKILSAAPGQYGAKVIHSDSLRQRYVDTPLGRVDTGKIKVLSNDGKTGVIITGATLQFEILAATHTVYSHNWIPRKEPFYIYLETTGEPVPLSADAAAILGVESIYTDYKIMFAGKKGWPLFNTTKEVEDYIADLKGLEPPAVVSSNVMEDPSVIIEADVIDLVLQQHFGDPLFIPLNNNIHQITSEGVLIKDPVMLQNLEDACLLDEEGEIPGVRLPRQHPFYIKVTTHGKADQTAFAKYDDIVRVYEDFDLQFGATKEGPFFNTVKEVEDWLNSSSSATSATE